MDSAQIKLKVSSFPRFAAARIADNLPQLPMVPRLSLPTTFTVTAPLFYIQSPLHIPLPNLRPPPRRTHFCITSISTNNRYQSTNAAAQQPRTLFPGGYKRPELKVPTLVLQLTPEEIFRDENALNSIDEAVSSQVGIVVLIGGEGTGKRLYEAACVLKSIVRDRAYFLIAERVDIAAAVNANGVLLSDQGPPAVVARNMMLNSRSESVFLPLVARNVQTSNAASNASNSEGADFLICSGGKEKQHIDGLVKSVFDDIKIPIFVDLPSKSLDEARKFVGLGADGFFISLGDLDLFSGGVMDQLFNTCKTVKKETNHDLDESDKDEFLRKDKVGGFVNLEDREKKLIETEKSVLLETIDVIQKAAPLMEEVSLLVDAVSQIDEPFLLVIAGEFNSGKSTFINALLGKRYLKEGVVPTTNEITFLRYSESDSEEIERCERHLDGQYICYLPAPILKEMTIVDTPGTNVILQRQQRLTEEFVPRADLLLFVISADRPLTESEVGFLRYTQQWKKRVVFVLNKSDVYQNSNELEKATSFIKQHTGKLLNGENVTLYPVSARYALEAKLCSSYDEVRDYGDVSISDSRWKTQSFYKLEKFLNGFLDGSNDTGMERIKLKLGTPVAIAEQLVSSCEAILRQDCQEARQDLTFVLDTIGDVMKYAEIMEDESISWRRKILSLIATTKSRVLELIESTLQLSNLDIVATYVFKGEKSARMPSTSRVQNDIIGPAQLDARKLLGEYMVWLQSSNDKQRRIYMESFQKRWPLMDYPTKAEMSWDQFELVKVKENGEMLKVVEKFNVASTSNQFEQEIREVFLEAFGGLGAAGLSASLLTSVLPTTMEDLLALGLCSAGGLLAISNFPERRRAVVEKVNKAVDEFAQQVEEVMHKDLSEAMTDIESFVNVISKPYRETAQQRLDTVVELHNQVSAAEKKLRVLQVDIQNLHVSRSESGF